jgi:flagellar motor switch protein FliN
MKTSKIMETKVTLDVVLGSTERPIKDIARINEGTLIELDSLAGEPVKLMAAGKLIAFGEVVVIDESFGIRVTCLVSKEKENDEI